MGRSFDRFAAKMEAERDLEQKRMKQVYLSTTELIEKMENKNDANQDEKP